MAFLQISAISVLLTLSAGLILEANAGVSPAAATGTSFAGMCFFIAQTGIAPNAGSHARKSAARKTVSPPAKRQVSIAEVESRGVYEAIEASLYRICIKEVPFFLALHACFYKDSRLSRGDTLVLGKKVLQSLLVTAARRLSTDELTITPATNIDSIMLFRPALKKAASTRCDLIIYTLPGAYEIPKTGARVHVPRLLRGAVSRNARTGGMFVTVFSRGVKLQLPGYAKLLSLGMITDMDIRYAELVPEGNGFEARLLYAAQDKQAKKRGWSFNVTECNKIRPYAR